MKLSEVSAGSSLTTGYVELKMIADGQRFVGGHAITVRDATGSAVHTFFMPADVDVGENQRTVLIGDDDVDADFIDTDLDLVTVGTAGAVCFDDALPPDCVSWGAGFGGNAMLPPPGAGTPFGGALPSGTSALHRDLSRSCSLTLEALDDTDSSAADFFSGPATPTRNAVAPGPGCPETTITKQPRKRATDRTPSFKFEATLTPATFECKLDDGAFEDCDSPLTLDRQPRGRHKIRVRATAGGGTDPTPATYGWKIVKPG